MLLEQFNESKLTQGASDAEIRQLPLISVRSVSCITTLLSLRSRVT